MATFISINKNAGNDLMRGSLTFICIATDPNNNIAKPMLLAKVKTSNCIEASNNIARLTFKKKIAK